MLPPHTQSRAQTHGGLRPTCRPILSLKIARSLKVRGNEWPCRFMDCLDASRARQLLPTAHRLADSEPLHKSRPPLCVGRGSHWSSPFPRTWDSSLPCHPSNARLSAAYRCGHLLYRKQRCFAKGYISLCQNGWFSQSQAWFNPRPDTCQPIRILNDYNRLEESKSKFSYAGLSSCGLRLTSSVMWIIHDHMV